MGKKKRRRPGAPSSPKGQREAPATPLRGRRLYWTILAAAGVIAAAGLAVVGSGRLGSHGEWQSTAVASPEGSREGDDLRRFDVKVLRSFDHDPTAYTQGLLWYDGFLYESTGRYGESKLRRWDPHTGRVVQSVQLSPRFFGEGLARVGERLIQLTWKEQVAFIYHRETFRRLGRWSYRGEGWGLCRHGEELVMSNGSDTLTFREPEGFTPIREVRVTLRGEPLHELNELESAEGWIFANVWQRDGIVRIDPQSGVVTGLVEAAGLLSPREQEFAEVLNGIAYNPESETFFLTGKLWPRIFEVVFVPH